MSAVDLHEQRRTRYGTALILIEHLVETAPVLPIRIAAECPTWAPDKVTVVGNFHKNLGALREWHAHFGGELTSETYKSGQVLWTASTVVDGIPVELWTLLHAEDGAE